MPRKRKDKEQAPASIPSKSATSANFTNAIWNGFVIAIAMAAAFYFGRSSAPEHARESVKAVASTNIGHDRIVDASTADSARRNKKIHTVPTATSPIPKASTETNTGTLKATTATAGTDKTVNISRGFRRVDPKEPRPNDTMVRTTVVQRAVLDARIARLRNEVDAQPQNVKALMELGNNLSVRDSSFGEGGAATSESVWCYEKSILVLDGMKSSLHLQGNDMDVTTFELVEVAQCMAHYYLALCWQHLDMYEMAMSSFDLALGYKCSDDDFLNLSLRRAHGRLIMGDYKEAMSDLIAALNADFPTFITNGLPNVIRIITADESSVEGGWDWLLSLINANFPIYKKLLDGALDQEAKETQAKILQKMLLAQFTYHDKVSQNTELAWKFLEESQQLKRVYTGADGGSELFKLQLSRELFSPKTMQMLEGQGSKSKAPIFIVGFPRSGTTLLERVLDAHSEVAGLGENSVFHGHAMALREDIVAGLLGSQENMKVLLNEAADSVVATMQDRWTAVKESREKSNDHDDKNGSDPTRLVDKLNTNNRNVGFINALFPNALIIHVLRNPMDSVFSSYKHDFNVDMTEYDGSTRNVDNMCEMDSLVKSYKAYRDSMTLWEDLLPPGRIFNIRYEEMVDDLEGVAKAVIAAAELEWNDEILSFHKKKQAVNTFSSTQVRKGIYTSSIDAWKKYEHQLQPLLELMGTYAESDLTTSFDYTPPQN